MDKWAKLSNAMLEQIPASEHSEAKPVLAFFVELGRTFEDIAQSADRIASHLERNTDDGR